MQIEGLLYRSGFSNLLPAGQFYVACEVIHILIVLAELMKFWNHIVLYYNRQLKLMVFIVKIHLKTWSIGVQPAVDLRKAML